MTSPHRGAAEAHAETRGREVCPRCRRPLAVCYCAHIPSLPSRTRVLLLQHPREHRTPIGTARMAHLALPNSMLRVGLAFDEDPAVRAALAGGPPPYVVFPHEDALPPSALPPAVTLVVLDGTWWQAQKLLKLNPALAALPRVAFQPRQGSEYRIRRQPADFCVSSIEALAEVLGALEPDAGPFDSLLDPFRAMVATQVRFQTEVRSNRHRKPPRAPAPPPRFGPRLGVDWSRLVCVQGECNAWPRRHPEHRPAEIVQWIAQRPASGEAYAALVAPRRPLAPGTPHHLEIDEDRLRRGVSVAEWRRSWEAFLRADDVLVQWGTFYGDLALGQDLPPPGRVIDLRSELLQMLRRPVGTAEECRAALGAPAGPPICDGRAGRRLAAMAAILRALWR